MIPGLPPYEWWKNPPDKVLLRVYVFNITNAVEFQNGTDSKIKLQEVGPYVFLPTLVPHTIHCDDPRYTDTGPTDLLAGHGGSLTGLAHDTQTPDPPTFSLVTVAHSLDSHTIHCDDPPTFSLVTVAHSLDSHTNQCKTILYAVANWPGCRIVPRIK
uniref:(California timema) hypothetical protein n=1 Tax=Timema californicum TaxID=61474 RepID=A0A7R9PAP6_TIMCA|nr:unnamed protein product [Timema californicum]